MKHLVLSRQASVEIRRLRQLPFPGQVLVESGQMVHPEDLLAEAELPGELYHLDLARGLGVEPSEVLACLVRDLGEDLEQGDVIAERDGALPRLVRAPRAGRLLACRNGMAVLAAGKQRVAVRAGMIGKVADVLPERGAVLRAHGGLFQAVWGNGRVGAGVLRVQTSSLEKPITPGELDTFGMGQVIAAGGCTEDGTLEQLLDRKPTGLILNSLSARLIPKVLTLPFPVVLLAGIGNPAPDQQTFALLQERGGDVVCVNASPPDPIRGEWPEVMIPGDADALSSSLPLRTALVSGQRVLALSGEHAGQVFTVAALPDEEILLESGLSSQIAVLDAGGGESIDIPRHNLVILGGLQA